MKTVEQIKNMLDAILEDICDCETMPCGVMEQAEYEHEKSIIKHILFEIKDDEQIMQYIKEIGEKEEQYPGSDRDKFTIWLWNWVQKDNEAEISQNTDTNN